MSAESSLWSMLEERLLPVFSDYRSRIADLPVEVKADRTLLTEADVAVQRLIVESIREFDPGAVVIAEEDERTEKRAEVFGSGGRIWVVDPIDGTAEFVRGERLEFCTVVCLLEEWQPTAAFVLAPELGKGRTPILATADARTRRIQVNGKPTEPLTEPSGHLSATRSAGVTRTEFDEAAAQAGYTVKARTTSQTLDMLRTALDLGPLTEPALPSFDLFWRREQKLWDGAAGLCFASAASLTSCMETGEQLPLNPDFLSAATPVFASDVTGRPETVAWFLRTVNSA